MKVSKRFMRKDQVLTVIEKKKEEDRNVRSKVKSVD